MPVVPAIALGLAFTLIGWLATRVGARAPLRSVASVALDVLVPLIAFVLIAALSNRPIFAGAVTFTLCAGFAIADFYKRRALGEPIIIDDFFVAGGILRHPRLCIIFPRPDILGIGVSLTIVIVVALYDYEAPVLQTEWWAGPGLILACIFGVWLVTGPLLAATETYLRRLQLTGRPQHDASRIGTMALQIAYGLLARAQRPSLQFAASPYLRRRLQNSASDLNSPVIVVQCESFFDARRLHRDIAVNLLPTYDACRKQAVQWGRLAVPAFGANTVRTEFSVLTGLAAHAAGFDRFNPYRRFASAPIASLPRQLRSKGYRTICVHPFDRTFYRRDKVLAHLGFDEFLGEEAFTGAARSNSYVADVEVARVITKLLEINGPKTFVFAITMENHGPWSPAANVRRNLVREPLTFRENTALNNYLRGIASADQMLRILTDMLRTQHEGGLLGFYGDHLPNLRGVFEHLEFESRRSDYLLWSSSGGAGLRKDIAAHQIGDAVLQALGALSDTREETRPSDVIVERPNLRIEACRFDFD